jgi:hypothetical protein
MHVVEDDPLKFTNTESRGLGGEKGKEPSA